MRSNAALFVLGMILSWNAAVQAQSIDTAIEELEERGVITRLIERYREDPGQYAYLKDMIMAVYDLTRKGVLTTATAAKIEALESQITALKQSRPTGEPTDTGFVKDLVRETVSGLLHMSEYRSEGFEAALRAESLKIAELEQKLTRLETRRPGTPIAAHVSVVAALFLTSLVMLLYAH